MAALQVTQKRREAGRCSNGQKGRFVGRGGKEVYECGEEKSCGLFFRGKTQKLGIEGNELLFAEVGVR